MPCARSLSVWSASRRTRCRSATLTACALRIPTSKRAHDAELHHQRDQVLLRAVVDVALDAPPFGVLRVDDAPPRRADLGRLRRDGFEAARHLGGETHVAHHKAGLRREVVEQTQIRR